MTRAGSVDAETPCMAWWGPWGAPQGRERWALKEMALAEAGRGTRGSPASRSTPALGPGLTFYGRRMVDAAFRDYW